MKKKIMVMAAALLAVLMLYVGCKKATDGDGSGNTVVVFTSSDENGTMTLYCYNDGTWVVHVKGVEEGVEMDLDMAAGTYTGNPAEDGECTVTTTKNVNIMGIFLATMMTGENPEKITNTNAPLQDVPAEEQKTETIIIVNGSFTLDGDTYTRK